MQSVDDHFTIELSNTMTHCYGYELDISWYETESEYYFSAEPVFLHISQYEKVISSDGFEFVLITDKRGHFIEVSNLAKNTEYNIEVTAIVRKNLYEDYSEVSEDFTFKVQSEMGKVWQNIEESTSSDIRIEWEEMESVLHYEIHVNSYGYSDGFTEIVRD
jgi:hypothetical protein